MTLDDLDTDRAGGIILPIMDFTQIGSVEVRITGAQLLAEAGQFHSPPEKRKWWRFWE